MNRAALGSSSTSRMRIVRSLSPATQFCCAEDETPMNGVVVFGVMMDHSERRAGGTRRSTPRGGRRPGDPRGYAPLVLVADDDAANGARCVAILSKLRFAVAPAHSVDEAIKVMRSL